MIHYKLFLEFIVYILLVINSVTMPLPPALAARLAKRGILTVEKSTPTPDEEVFAEDYDKPASEENLDEFGNSLPLQWQKVWEPSFDTYYYWDTVTDQVSWLPPGDPEAVITWPSGKRVTIESKESTNKSFYSKPHKVNNERVKSKNKSKDAFDPMDPSSYSDAPRGNWSAGLKKVNDAKTGVDSTANGPLFQQRPYPSPGEVLSRNKQAHRDFGPVKPS